MRVALIAPGLLPIPPVAWGAVELIVWQMKLGLERLGHDVDVYNSRMVEAVVERINEQAYDFVHCHTESFVESMNRTLQVPYALTCHHGGVFGFETGEARYQHFETSLAKTLSAPANIVLSERIARLLRRSDYTRFLRVLPNGIDVERFRWAPRGNGRAICLGQLSDRKRQAWLAHATQGEVAVDFVGPLKRGCRFDGNETATYLGEWTRETVYEGLSKYSCLVLLSESESCAPLVVLEALAAGVSVVISDACADNLTDEEFVTVLSPDELTPQATVSAIRAAISRNERLRRSIRAYATEYCDVRRTVRTYVRIIEEFKEAFRPV